MTDLSLLKKELFLLLEEKGAKLVGVGDLSGITKNDMKTGISVAVPLPKQIVQDLKIAPTQEYYLSSFITNAPLPFDSPVNQCQCGTCNICVKNCPGNALTGNLWNTNTTREELLNKEICYQTQIHRMKKSTGIEADLCGLCFAICPYTQRWLNKTVE